jgi:hypothetical protein
MARYRIEIVGAAHHTEWWVPAAELEELNDNIVGSIEVIREFGVIEPENHSDASLT